PPRRAPEFTEAALPKAREDKLRESGDGFDGTWVAHPDLVPVAMAIFDDALGDRPNQKDRRRDEGRVTAHQLLDLTVAGGAVSEAGIPADIRVALAYLDAWLSGTGAAAIDTLMEAAGAGEIARSQLWLWRTRDLLAADRYAAIRDEELARLGGPEAGRLGQGARALCRPCLVDDPR